MSNEMNEEIINEVEESLESAQEEIVESMSELETIQAELNTLKETYARVHADFDNIKKRLEREKYQALEYANEKLGTPSSTELPR